MTPFNLKIITPEKTFFEGTTTQIIAKTTTGNVGILHGHVPYVANLVSSPFKIEIEGTLKEAALSGGFIKVSGEDVIVVTNAIEWADEIDVARAERSKQNAEERKLGLSNEAIASGWKKTIVVTDVPDDFVQELKQTQKEDTK